ncbi:MAG: hypothetical protein H6887_03865 [Hoeflea sp.]|nr:hypothetical protein [Hoeflea sp.]
MQNRNLFSICSTIFAMILSLIANSKAAEIGPSNSKECVLSLTGEIFEGDLEKLKAADIQYYRDDYDETTKTKTLCLNSPGGSIAESAIISQYIYDKGIGTVVDNGAECYSACAIIFMMGRMIGPEIEGLNRRMYYNSIIGFHRPFLNLNIDISANSRDLEAAFDAAYSSAVDLINLANNTSPWSTKPMIESDLVQKMLEHRGNNFYYIDTVDKAGRWQIEVFGFNQPSLLDKRQAYHSCENSLQWEGQLTEKAREKFGDNPRISDVDANLDSYVSLVKGYKDVYYVSGINDGMVSSYCYISKKYSDYLQTYYVRGCGEDQSLALSIGYGACDKDNFSEKFYPLETISVFDSRTLLKDLNSEYYPQRSAEIIDLGNSEGVSNNIYACYVYNFDTLLNKEYCSLIFTIDSDDGEFSEISTFTWPSGDKTVVIKTQLISGDGSYKYSYSINGNPTKLAKYNNMEYCFLNSATRNRFCAELQ